MTLWFHSGYCQDGVRTLEIDEKNENKPIFDRACDGVACKLFSLWRGDL